MPGLGLITKVKEDVTVDRLKELFPDKKNSISEKHVELINEVQSNPEFNGAELLDTMTTYQSVMYKNSSSLGQYLDAIQFCAYLESSDDSSTEAYKKTFYKRDFVRERRDLETESVGYRELTSAASRYRKSPLVMDILVQADVPLYLMFQGYRYQAVTQLATEMTSAAYAKDRINAADKLLTHVKPPENMKIELDVGMSDKNKSAIDDLRKATEELASAQMESIKAGVAVKYIAESTIVDVEVEDE